MAFSCLADFERDVTIYGDKFEGRFDFFMAVFVIGWVVVLFVFFVFLFGLEGNIATERNWNILVSIYSDVPWKSKLVNRYSKRGRHGDIHR